MPPEAEEKAPAAPPAETENSEVRELKAKLAEFRTNNISLLKQNEMAAAAAQEKAKAVEELKNQLNSVQDKQKLEAGDFESLFTTRTERLQGDHKAQLSKKEKVIEELTNKLTLVQQRESQLAFSTAINDAVTKVRGVKNEALRDVQGRASEVFKMVDGRIKAMDHLGVERYDSEGNPLTPTSWLKELRNEAPHLFQGSVGSGAQGGQPITPIGNLIGVEQLRNKALSGNDIANIASGKTGIVG